MVLTHIVCHQNMAVQDLHASLPWSPPENNRGNQMLEVVTYNFTRLNYVLVFIRR